MQTHRSRKEAMFHTHSAGWLAALLPLAAALGATSAAHALPMGSVDTWMVMGDGAARSSEVAANRALTPRDALGIVAGRWRAEPEAGGRAREFGGLTYTRLVQRWNLPHAQANLWFVGAAGGLRAEGIGGTRAMGSVAVLADYETTRVYFGAGAKTMRSSPAKQDTLYARAGFSFYEAEYDEIQPWLIGEVKRQRDGIAKTETAAWLRLIHKRYFVELGADDEGRARFNFMFNFW
jgi:hypothetical protein